LTLVEFDDQEIEEVVKAVDLASLCVDPQRRAAAGLTSLGRGAYADVVCFNASTQVECDAVKIPARRLAVKVGSCVEIKFRAPDAIDAMLSSQLRLLDGVEAHEGLGNRSPDG